MKIDIYLNKVKMVEKSMELSELMAHSDDAKIAFNMFDVGALQMLKILARDDHDINVDDYLTLTIEISKLENRK